MAQPPLRRGSLRSRSNDRYHAQYERKALSGASRPTEGHEGHCNQSARGRFLLQSGHNRCHGGSCRPSEEGSCNDRSESCWTCHPTSSPFVNHRRALFRSNSNSSFHFRISECEAATPNGCRRAVFRGVKALARDKEGSDSIRQRRRVASGPGGAFISFRAVRSA